MRVIKLNKKTKAKLKAADQKSRFYGVLKARWLAAQEKSVKEYKWRGSISPSAKLWWGLCVVDFFKKVDKPLDFAEATLMSINGGTLIHKGLEDEVVKHRLYYDLPKLPTKELKEWYERIKPEIPLDCPELGVRAKVDDVLDADGFPGPFDVKTKWYTETEWEKYVYRNIPEPCHKMQVYIYAHLIKKYKYFDKPIKEVGIGYLNVPTSRPFLNPKSYFEWWGEYTESLDRMVGVYLKAFSAGREEKLAGETVRCRNPLCLKHGQYLKHWHLAHGTIYKGAA